MPTIKLTEKAIERIPFADDSTPVEYYDTKLTGFGVRAGLKSKTYFVKGRAKGEQFKRKIGKVGLLTFDDAYRQAHDVLKDADQGLSPDDREEKEVQADMITIRQVLKKYFTTRKNLKPRTKELYENSLEWYLSDWWDKPMRSITPAMVVTKHAEVGIKSKAQADGVFRVVRALFNFAIDIQEEDEKEIITRNPVRRLSTLKAWYKVPRKQTFVKPTQLHTFFDAVKRSPGLVSDYLLVLLFTGVRSESEIASLLTTHVDFKEQAITLLDTKTKEYLYVPVSGSAMEALKRRVEDAKQQGCPYLFYSFQPQSARYGKCIPQVKDGKHDHIRDVRGTIKAIFADTELSKITPHDMRRTFLTYADELGISNVVQKRLVGHAIPTDVTDGYKVLTMDRLRNEVAKVEAYILENRSKKSVI